MGPTIVVAILDEASGWSYDLLIEDIQINYSHDINLILSMIPIKPTVCEDLVASDYHLLFDILLSLPSSEDFTADEAVRKALRALVSGFIDVNETASGLFIKRMDVIRSKELTVKLEMQAVVAIDKPRPGLRLVVNNQ
jgi:hypothetical protein